MGVGRKASRTDRRGDPCETNARSRANTPMVQGPNAPEQEDPREQTKISEPGVDARSIGLKSLTCVCSFSWVRSARMHGKPAGQCGQKGEPSARTVVIGPSLPICRLPGMHWKRRHQCRVLPLLKANQPTFMSPDASAPPRLRHALALSSAGSALGRRICRSPNATAAAHLHGYPCGGDTSRTECDPDRDRASGKSRCPN